MKKYAFNFRMNLHMILWFSAIIMLFLFINSYQVAQAFSLKLEAEDQILDQGPKWSIDQTGYSGRGFVSGISNIKSNVGFTNVKVPVQGIYNLKIRYSLPDKNPGNLSLYINGNKSKTIHFPSVSNGNIWADKIETIEFSGTTELAIFFVRDAGGRPEDVKDRPVNLDYIMVYDDAKEITIYYRGNITPPYFVFRENNNNWTVEPGNKMVEAKEAPGYFKAMITTRSNQLEVGFNNGVDANGKITQWDRNYGKNYLLTALENEDIFTIDQGAVIKKGPPPNSNTTKTIHLFYKGELSNPSFNYNNTFTKMNISSEFPGYYTLTLSISSAELRNYFFLENVQRGESQKTSFPKLIDGQSYTIEYGKTSIGTPDGRDTSTKPVLTELLTDQKQFTSAMGTKISLNITGLWSDGKSWPLDWREANLFSANPAVAYIASGQVIAQSAGSTTLTVNYKGKSVSMDVMVTPAYQPESITADSEMITFEKTDAGVMTFLPQQHEIQLFALSTDGKRTSVKPELLTWKSENQAIATVENGIVYPQRTGVTVVSGFYKGKEIKIIVHIYPRKQIRTLLVRENAIEMFTGTKSEPITLQMVWDDGTTEVLKISEADVRSHDETIVTVDRNGLLSGLKAGKTTVTAGYRGHMVAMTVSVIDFEKSPRKSKREPFENIFLISDLIANTEEFERIGKKFTTDELKMIVPEKQILNVRIEQAQIVSDITVKVGRATRKLKIQSGSEISEARRADLSTFKLSLSRLPKGADIFVTALDGNDQHLEQLIIKIKNESMSVSNENQYVTAGVYPLSELITDLNRFNGILTSYALRELKIGTPQQFIEKVTYQELEGGYDIVVKTRNMPYAVFILKEDGTPYKAVHDGNGVFNRKVLGVRSSEGLTIRIVDEDGGMLHEQSLFMD